MLYIYIFFLIFTSCRVCVMAEGLGVKPLQWNILTLQEREKFSGVV